MSRLKSCLDIVIAIVIVSPILLVWAHLGLHKKMTEWTTDGLVRKSTWGSGSRYTGVTYYSWLDAVQMLWRFFGTRPLSPTSVKNASAFGVTILALTDVSKNLELTKVFSVEREQHQDTLKR